MNDDKKFSTDLGALNEHELAIVTGGYYDYRNDPFGFWAGCSEGEGGGPGAEGGGDGDGAGDL